MKNAAGKIRRSGIYQLMIPVAPVNEVRSAQFDICGAAIVVALLVGIVSLMRVILTA